MKIKSGLPAIIIFLMCLSFMSWGFTSKSEEQKQEAKPLAAHTEIDQGTAYQNTTNPTTDITNEDKSTNDGANLPLTADSFTLAAEAFGLKVDDLAVTTDSITLELAIKEDSLERTKAILKNGANPNLKNPITKRTPLEVAAMHTSSDEITRLLFAHGAKIDMEDSSDYSLLTRAITTAAPASLIRALIENGADANEEYRGKTLLQLALGDRDGRFRPQRYKEGHPEYSEKKSPAQHDVIFALIEAGADVHKKLTAHNRKKYGNILNEAITKKNVSTKIIETLVEAGLEVNPKEGAKPLITAVRSGNINAAKTLIELGADVDGKGNFQWTPLHEACYRLKSNFVHFLLDQGANPNATDSHDKTPLSALLMNSSRSNLEIFKRELEHYSNPEVDFLPDVRKKNIASAEKKINAAIQLEKRIENSFNSILKMLIENGVDIHSKDSNGWTPLMHAANSAGKSWKIEAFLFQEAKVSETSNEGMTPLMIAAYGNPNVEIIESLIGNGSQVNARSNVGATALMQAAKGSSNLEILKHLVRKGADVSAQDNQGETALMYAAGNTHRADIVEYLLSQSKEVPQRNKSGWNPLMIAAYNNTSIEVMKLLATQFPDLTVTNDEGWSPLIIACYKNSNPEIVSWLIQQGANIESTNSQGMTPLMVAACCNPNPAILQQLLERGANPKTRCNNSKTALDYARDNKSLKNSQAIHILETQTHVESSE